MLRAFAAVQLPASPPLATALEGLWRLGHGLRVVPAENLHLTLKFFGATEDAVLPRLAEVFAAAVPADAGAIQASVEGLGAFPDAHRPRVVWAGLRGEPGVRRLAELAQRLDRDAAALGFAPERRPWRPHVTLARIRERPPAGLARFLKEHHDADLGTVRFASVELMLSELTTQGARYTIAATAPLVAG